MEEEPEHPARPNQIKLGPVKLKRFFISHLDRIYAAKAHLVSKLPLILDEVHFRDLKFAVEETLTDVEKQMARMEMVYELLDAEPSNAKITGLIGIVEEVFASVLHHKNEPALRDLSIIFYLQNIESVEMASFQILQIAAVKLKNKQIKQLIRENYDEAKADRSLLLLISSKYVTS